MAARPNISDAEWEVMNVLWQRFPLTATEVVEELGGPKDWDKSTIRTLLYRLVEKRAVSVSGLSKFNRYRPLVTRHECVQRESRSFLSRVFRGAVGPMLIQFVRQADLTPKDVKELKRALKEKSWAGAKCAPRR